MIGIMPRKASDKSVSATTKNPKQTAKTVITTDDGTRRFTTASYRSRRKRRQAERVIARTKVTNSFILFGRALKMLRNHWEIFGGIVLIYTIINIVLVGGFSGSADLQQTKDSLADVFTGQFSKLSAGLSLFGFLVASGTGVASGVASAYQTILVVIVSLAIVWALRQLYANNKIRIRDTFYNATYPLVQVLLVLLMITVHLLPAVFGVFLFNILVLQGILTVTWQQAIVDGVAIAGLTWTIYLLTASLIAAYIVTLPEMTPIRALRSAKDIVRYRRAMVFRKLLFLPVVLLVISAIIMVPLTVIYTPAATIVFFLLTSLAIPVVHSYMYSLYRELIS